jgi:Ca-activated chloride channel family protein
VRAVSFTWPLALLVLLVVPLVLGAVWWLDRRRTRYAVAFTNLAVLADVVPPRQRRRAWIPLVLFLLALACASVALARPRAVVSRPAQQATVVLLVDVSGSMRAADVKPTRLGAAQRAMNAFMAKLPKKFKVGLVSYSTEPNVLVAPTTDRALMAEGIGSLLPESGTALGDGLAVAVSVAKAGVGPGARRGKDGLLPAAIVLLSDGAQTRGTLQPLEGADLAKRAGIPVFTVALGTNHGTLNFDRGGGGFFNGGGGGGGNGNFPGFRFNVRPDPTTLRAIARDTKGQAYTAKTASRVEEVYKGLGSRLVRKKEKREISSWFVGGAALLLLGSLGAARLTAEALP